MRAGAANGPGLLLFCFALNDTTQMKAEYNTSRAVSNHFVRYMYKINHANDYSFALRADHDYANVYDAWWALIDINNQMFKETGRYPMNLYAAIRWLSASEAPLSGAYGPPGARYVLIEASSAHGTGAYTLSFVDESIWHPGVRACVCMRDWD